jgi:hypothetical protein
VSRDRLVAFAEVPLVTIESSGTSGTAPFEEVDGGVRVDLEVEGLPKPGTRYLAHIHPGTCGGVENGGGHEHGEVASMARKELTTARATVATWRLGNPWGRSRPP